MSQVVISKDGTRIAFERRGKGTPVILVDGSMSSRAFGPMRPLAAELSKHFTVYAYDRRGRGESTDTHPYAAEREIEDIDALIVEAGGSGYLFGISSGAVLALKAAARLGTAKVLKLAVYEPPFNSDDDKAKEDFARFTRHMAELLKADRRGDAVAFFLSDILPPKGLEEMRRSPEWLIMEELAPTLAYDNAVMGDGSVPAEAAKYATMSTLIIDGSESLAFLREAAGFLAKAMPHAERKTLEGQTHNPSPEVLAPALASFYNA
ncbi:MAG: alpha/beta hydrolase [Euryarchaeota archaeon]|nr:alpha/beta hydrolase [Euryarchaeota archaeon]